MKSFFYKILYNRYINFFLRNFLKLFNERFRANLRIHPSGYLKINIQNKNIIYLKTNQTNYVTVKLFWEGYENFEYSLIFIDLIKNVRTFIDVGSNIGYYSIIGATLNKELKVISFEPSGSVFKYLSQNIIINNLSNNVVLEKIALSNRIGFIKFFELYNTKYPNIDNLSGEHNIGTKKLKFNKPTKVKSTTLDEYILSNKVNRVDLIKLDTEGSEHLIIKKGLKIIRKFKPIIICEVLFDATNRKSIDKFLKNLNYSIYYHNDNKLFKINSLQKNLIKGVNDYFFLHSSKEYLIHKYIDY